MMGNNQEPNISKQMTFKDSTLVSGLQMTNKMLKSLDSDLYAFRAERNERSIREHRSPGRQMFRNRNKSRYNSSVRSNDRTRNGRIDSRQKSNRHCKYCDQDSHTWKYCWEMQANAVKARRLKEMGDRYDDLSDTFNSIVSEDPISDDAIMGISEISLT